MRRFDSKALYNAINTQREGRGMTWTDVSKEIGVSTSTITGTKKGGRMEVDGMLAMVHWLGESAETFVRERDF